MLTADVQELASKDYPELLLIFSELKNSLQDRLVTAWQIGRREQMFQAIQEVSKMLDVTADIITNGLKGYDLSNIIHPESDQLISSHFKKDIKSKSDELLATYEIILIFCQRIKVRQGLK